MKTNYGLSKIKEKLHRGLNSDHLKLRKFQNKIEIDITVGSYQVKTASTKREVIESLQLRHQVFYAEFLGKNHPTGLDLDRYDTFFDHLIVVDKKTQNLVATYRLYSSQFGDDFYSKSQFDLENLKFVPGPILEIGRACVQKNYRKSTVLACLWRGIFEYLKVSKGRTLMGCGSVKTENPDEVARLNLFFEKNNYVHPKAFCPPLTNYQMAVPSLESLDEISEANCSEMIPSLFRSYLKAGAKVSRFPAWDKDFKCVDYLIILDTSQMLGNYEKKYS